MELCPPVVRWRGQLFALADVIADGQHQELLRHIHGFRIGFTLGGAITEIRKCHRIASRLSVGFEKSKVIFHWRPHIFKSRSFKILCNCPGLDFLGGMAWHT
jgi:hypothetical protein